MLSYSLIYLGGNMKNLAVVVSDIVQACDCAKSFLYSRGGENDAVIVRRGNAQLFSVYLSDGGQYVLKGRFGKAVACSDSPSELVEDVSNILRLNNL